jgi:hypothetical protein
MWQFWEQETTMVLDLRLQGCYGNSRVRVWSGSGSIEDLYMKFYQEWFNSNFYKDLIFFKKDVLCSRVWIEIPLHFGFLRVVIMEARVDY